jgi:hypothetical protein
LKAGLAATDGLGTAQKIGDFDIFRTDRVDLRHPSHGRDAVDRALEALAARGHAQEFREIEARAAKTPIMEALELPVRRRVVDDGRADVALFLCEEIKQQRMVRSVRGRLHHQAASDAQGAVHAAHVLDMGGRRRIFGAGPNGIFRRVGEDMNLAIPRACGGFGRGRARVALEFRIGMFRHGVVLPYFDLGAECDSLLSRPSSAKREGLKAEDRI